MNKKIKIWCTYHDLQQIIDYQLQDSDILKLYYANDLSLKENNINNLNMYLGELVTYYYVWKNQIKSDYIGFCHYRRHFSFIKYDYIDNNHIQTFMNGYMNLKDFSKVPYSDKLSPIFIDYMKDKYDINIDINKNYKGSFKLSFLMTWDVFNNVSDFIFGYFDYISNKLNINWKTSDGLNQLINGWERSIAVFCEFIIGIYINLIFDTDDFDVLRKDIIILNNINYKQIYLCERLTPCNIYMFTNKPEEDELYKLNWDLRNNFIDNKQLKYIVNENKDRNIIILKDNEYIDCKDSFEFYKGNYSIKQL